MYMQPVVREKTFPSLTLRQRQILNLLARGETRQSVARILYLSEGTVNGYVTLILQRLGAQNITHAVDLATRQRLLPLDEN